MTFTGPGLTETELRTTPVPVSISGSVPLPAGAATEATLLTRASEATLATKASEVTLASRLAEATFAARFAINAALADADGNPNTTRIGSNLLLWNGATWDRAQSSGDNADAVAVATLARQFALARMYGFNGTTWDRLRSTLAGLYTDERPATLNINVAGAANAIATATLPAAGAGLFHYITHIFIKRVNTAALAGGAILSITTTNLGGRQWRTGNQASITVSTHEGSVLRDQEFTHPLKSAVANTASTIVCPAAGAAVSWHLSIDYFTAI
jgi:hypothetical protein